MMEKSLSHTSEEASFVHHERQTRPQGAKSQQIRSSTCHQCGLACPHKTGSCPAEEKTCQKCGKPNHFAKMCLTKSSTKPYQQQQQQYSQKVLVNLVSMAQEQLASSSDDKYSYTMNYGLKSRKSQKHSLRLTRSRLK